MNIFYKFGYSYGQTNIYRAACAKLCSFFMTTVDSSKKICTLINVFTVDPGKHLELFENLKEATEKVMSKLPGYISANLHISDDKKTVTNYAQWGSLKDFQNMQKNEEAGKRMKLAVSLAIDFKPVTYNSIWTNLNND